MDSRALPESNTQGLTWYRVLLRVQSEENRVSDAGNSVDSESHSLKWTEAGRTGDSEA